MTAGGQPPAALTHTGSAFVATACALMALVSLSIDAILPGLNSLASDLGVADGNRRQWVITALFLGLAGGQLIWGPMSDSIGRRKAILLGVAVFSAGSILSAMAQTFEAMLTGRIIQGFGVAAPRTVTVAMIRDRFEGATMARLMSLIMSVFILVPVLAPGVGQLVLLIADWRVLFVFVMLFSWAATAALLLLVPERKIIRPAFNLRNTRAGMAMVLMDRKSMAITVAGGCIYGALMGYINSSEQIFHDVFDTGDLYPAYFGGLAVFMAAATVMNRTLVTRCTMHSICSAALTAHCAWTAVFLLAQMGTGGLGIMWFLIYSAGTLFALGLTFGNINAMALHPFGHIAGTAAAVQATLLTLISLITAAVIGNLFDGTLMPVLVGYMVMGLIAVALLRARL